MWHWTCGSQWELVRKETKLSDEKLNVATIWLTGLTASGKSTLSERLYQDLVQRGIINVVLLDGEAVRNELKNHNYTTDDRNAVGIAKAEIALKYNKQGQIVIITGIAHHRETRDKIRHLFENYSEVYLKCTAEDCANRDFKGHYKKAFAGEYEDFIGVTEPYEESEPDLILDTATNSIDECADKLYNYTMTLLRAPTSIG